MASFLHIIGYLNSKFKEIVFSVPLIKEREHIYYLTLNLKHLRFTQTKRK